VPGASFPKTVFNNHTGSADNRDDPDNSMQNSRRDSSLNREQHPESDSLGRETGTSQISNSHSLRPAISLAIPCFNQGRFLIDCLESVAIQTSPPCEVLLVNDGSTDHQTLELLQQLPQYVYPFPLRLLHKPNGGPSSARNLGIDQCRGDAVLFLDGDDKLTPDAIDKFRNALAADPGVDVVYPDVQAFGNETWQLLAPEFNAWRLCQGNFMVSCSAVRRRVFDAGYRFDERLRSGMEDWEFWIRTCALGPFRAAPLKSTALEYRQWGHSITSAVNETEVAAQIRKLHHEAGLWNDESERQLRQAHAPSHTLFTLPGEPLPAADDFQVRSCHDAHAEVAHNATSRFLWIGEFPPQWLPTLQLVVTELAAQRCAAAYVFRHADSQLPYAVAYDRFWILDHPRCFPKKVIDAGPVVAVDTSGIRQLQIEQIAQQRRLRSAERSFVSSYWQALKNSQLLPDGHAGQTRLAKELWYYLPRVPARPRLVANRIGQRVLAVAIAGDTPLDTLQQVQILLASDPLRSRFDQLMLLPFHDPSQRLPAPLMELFDAVVPLGSLPLTAAAQLELAVDLCRTTGVTDLLIVHCRAGLELIGPLRRSPGNVRIAAVIQEGNIQAGQSVPETDIPSLLASRYANLIDRVVTDSVALSARLTDELYFPKGRLKTLALRGTTPAAVDLARHRAADAATATSPPNSAANLLVAELVEWLFGNPGASPATRLEGVFGVPSAA
jgi:Glycosyl transferase family 2